MRNRSLSGRVPLALAVIAVLIPPASVEPAFGAEQNSDPAPAVGIDPPREPEGFVVFESEITTRSTEMSASTQVDARIPMFAEGDELPRGEENLTVQNFDIDLPPMPAPALIHIGSPGRMAATGAIHAAEDPLDLMIRRVPDVQLVIVPKQFPAGMSFPVSAPFWFAPLVLFHGGEFTGERTIVQDPSECRITPTPGVSEVPSPSMPGMPSFGGVGNPMAGFNPQMGLGMGFGADMSAIPKNMCVKLTGWTRIDPGTDPTEKTWLKEINRKHTERGAVLTENTRVVVSTCTPVGMPIAPDRNPWSDEDFLLDPVRDPILYMSKEEFESDTAAQDALWQYANEDVEVQRDFGAEVLKAANAKGKVNSILKRPTKEGFIDGVIKKAERNQYSQIGQMDDMVRGRFNLEDRTDVMKVARHIAQQQQFPVKIDAIELPRRPVEQELCPCGFGFGYPRYHVIVRTQPNGLTHEWQIGTGAASEIYERPGIEVPDEMEQDVEDGLIQNDLHDVDYDIFRACVRKGKLSSDGPGDYERLGLKDFGDDLDQVSAAADCLGDDYKGLDGQIERLHQQAGDLLQKVVNQFGYDAVSKECYH